MNALLSVPAIQTVDGKYALLREIGSDSCGTVWEAKHLIVGKRVALKLLGSEIACDHRLRARFVSEVRAAARIQHPNVVEIYDLGVSNEGNSYMVMELLCGETLGDMLERRGPLAPMYACELTLQVLAALTAAHAKGILHGNLKPDNVVVAHPRPDHPHVKVLDFGITAGLMQAAREPHGTVFGTPGYKAPGQALALAVDARADVYAAGAMLLEMLTGQQPFAERSAISMASRSRGRPVDARMYAPNVPCELANAVSRALSPDPAQRQQTAAELAADLVPFVRGAASSIAPAGVPTVDPKRSPSTSCAPVPLRVRLPVQIVQPTEPPLAADFSCIELDRLACHTPPLALATPSLLELPLPPPARPPTNFGPSPSGAAAVSTGDGRGAPTPCELALRCASTLPPTRPRRRAGMRSAIYATLTGLSTAVTLAWIAGLI